VTEMPEHCDTIGDGRKPWSVPSYYIEGSTTENGCTRRSVTSHRCSFWATGSSLSNRKNW